MRVESSLFGNSNNKGIVVNVGGGQEGRCQDNLGTSGVEE